MGKAVQRQQHTDTLSDLNDPDRSSNRCRFCDIIRFRCVLVLLFSVSVTLSALFLLPPFLKKLGGGDLDLTYKSYEIVATFALGKPVSLLEDNINKLEDDIFTEIEAPTVKVEILFLIPTPGSNITKVVFAIVPDDKSSKISETGLSLIRANFVFLIVRKYSLRLTPSFGDPFSFEVLKFSGGITVIPPQSAFLLQKVQILFNFTLNYSINQTLENFHTLTSQLTRGLHLSSYENLYIKLTNPKGSTVAIPTTLQTTVVLAVGNTPLQERVKQLAKTITHSHVRNLGLNNTVFGKVKQVRLSSILQHSLSSPAPAPSPMPRHHHHHHHTGSHLSPAPSPAYELHIPKIGKKDSPAHAPVPSRMRDPIADPPGCPFVHQGRNKRGYTNYHFFPPVDPPVHELAPSPSQRINPPASAFSPSYAFSPLSHYVNGPISPPVQSEPDISPLEMVPSISPSPSQSSAGSFLLPPLWVIPSLLVLAMLL